MDIINKEKLERMIRVAKKVLEINPNDTWVFKGLQLMEDELRRINGDSEEMIKKDIEK